MSDTLAEAKVWAEVRRQITELCAGRSQRFIAGWGHGSVGVVELCEHFGAELPEIPEARQLTEAEKDALRAQIDQIRNADARPA